MATYSQLVMNAEIAHQEIKDTIGIWFEEYGLTLELGYTGDLEGPACGSGDRRSWTVWVRNIKTNRGYMDLGYVSTEDLPDLLERLTIEELTRKISWILQSTYWDARFATVRNHNDGIVHDIDESESIIRSFVGTFSGTEV